MLYAFNILEINLFEMFKSNLYFNIALTILNPEAHCIFMKEKSFFSVSENSQKKNELNKNVTKNLEKSI